MKFEIPWTKIDSFLLVCESECELRGFTDRIINSLHSMIRYTIAYVHFYSSDQKLVDYYSIGETPQRSQILMEYYAHMESFAKYDLPPDLQENPNKPSIFTIDWTNEEPSELINEFVHYGNIKHTLLFRLFDLQGSPRTVISLTRREDTPFSTREIGLLSIVYLHLNNLHKKFYLSPAGNAESRRNAILAAAALTKREKEVANLLCDGVTPANVSKVLRISPATTHKHITHIYEKLRVSSIQELIVFLLRK